MTLYVVQASGMDDEALARARFVADRFSWPAFIFAWAWLLYRGLWLTFVLWIVAEAAFLVLAAPHVSLSAIFVLDVLARLMLGLEAHRLRLAKGARHAALTEFVEARDRDEAETIFYARYQSDEVQASETHS